MWLQLRQLPDRSLALCGEQLNARPAEVEAQQTNQVSAGALQPDCLQVQCAQLNIR
jgi:hypothetical protein